MIATPVTMNPGKNMENPIKSGDWKGDKCRREEEDIWEGRNDGKQCFLNLSSWKNLPGKLIKTQISGPDHQIHSRYKEEPPKLNFKQFPQPMLIQAVLAPCPEGNWQNGLKGQSWADVPQRAGARLASTDWRAKELK